MTPDPTNPVLAVEQAIERVTRFEAALHGPWLSDAVIRVYGAMFDGAKDGLAADLRLILAHLSQGWKPIESAPKDGTHILACQAGSSFGWKDGSRLPPVQTVVHWFSDPDEPGFYTSVNELEPQRPFPATHWKPLDAPTQSAGGTETDRPADDGEGA